MFAALVVSGGVDVSAIRWPIACSAIGPIDDKNALMILALFS